MRTLDDYLALVPSFNRGKPNFIATLSAVLQPFLDAQTFLASVPTAFDIDVAVGPQLDAVGAWVGQSRFIPIPLQNLWFSLDDAVRGFDKGIWRGPYDTGSGITRLDDETYRRLLYAIIDVNDWDGTIGQAITALADYFNNPATGLFIEDRGDMSVIVGFAQEIPSVLDILLLSKGYIPLKSEGVNYIYLVTSINNTPLFGLDVESYFVGGFDRGSWGVSPDYIALNAI